jgi:hypothetical protein
MKFLTSFLLGIFSFLGLSLILVHQALLLYGASKIRRLYKPLDRVLLTTESALPVIYGLSVAFVATLSIRSKTGISRTIWVVIMIFSGFMYCTYGLVFAIKLNNAVNSVTFRVSVANLFPDFLEEKVDLNASTESIDLIDLKGKKSSDGTKRGFGVVSKGVKKLNFINRHTSSTKDKNDGLKNLQEESEPEEDVTLNPDGTPLTEEAFKTLETTDPTELRTLVYLGRRPFLTFFTAGFVPSMIFLTGAASVALSSKEIWMPFVYTVQNSLIKLTLKRRKLPLIQLFFILFITTTHGILLGTFNHQLKFSFKPLERTLLNSDFLLLTQFSFLSFAASLTWTLYPTYAPYKRFIGQAWLICTLYTAGFYILYGLSFTIRLKFAVKGHSFRESVQRFLLSEAGQDLKAQGGFAFPITKFTRTQKDLLSQLIPVKAVRALTYLAYHEHLSFLLFGLLPAIVLSICPLLHLTQGDNKGEEEEEELKVDFSKMKISRS